MAQEEVRLQYSGFVLFLSRLLSVGTGLLFSLMVTRNITVQEFGVYGNIADVLYYFTLAAGIFPFWEARFVARKHPGSSTTGLIANLLISLPISLIYLIILPPLMAVFQVDAKYLIVYVVISIHIFELYLQAALEAALQAKRPQALGFGFLVFELSKVVFGFALIMHLELGLLGVMASVILALLFQILFYLKLMLHELREKIFWSYIKEWLKASFLNLYGIIGQRLLAFTTIFLFVYGGELSRAYYGAASTIAGIIGYSSYLAFALYPRLLSETRAEDVSISIKMVLMFAIPMTIGAIILSDSFLIILSPQYANARFVLTLLSLDFLFLTISSISDAVVGGTENLDAEAKISYKNIVRSKIFLTITLPYIKAAAIVPLTYIVLISIVKDPIEAATYVAIINLSASIAITAAKYMIARKCLAFDVPWSNIGKYLFASLPMALALFLLPPPTRIITTLATALLGAILYFLLLSVIDEETRIIAKSARGELLKALRISRAKGA